jgi:hypothetical protein
MENAMNSKPLQYAVATALVATLALAGCKKKEEAVPPPVAAEPAPAPPVTPAPMPAAAATASVVSVDLGNAVGPDMKVTTPMTTFGKKDTVIAAVTTSTSDPLATVPGKLGAKWTFQDGQVVNDESKDVNFTGTGVTDFQVAKPDGWPAGNYKVEISLDGNLVQSKDFSVK